MSKLWLWVAQELLSGRVEETCTFSQNLQMKKKCLKNLGPLWWSLIKSKSPFGLFAMFNESSWQLAVILSGNTGAVQTKQKTWNWEVGLIFFLQWGGCHCLQKRSAVEVNTGCVFWCQYVRLCRCLKHESKGGVKNTTTDHRCVIKPMESQSIHATMFSECWQCSDWHLTYVECIEPKWPVMVMQRERYVAMGTQLSGWKHRQDWSCLFKVHLLSMFVWFSSF